MGTVSFVRGTALLAVLALVVAACGASATPPPSSAPVASEGAATAAPSAAPAAEARTLQLWRIFNECASQHEGVTELGDTTDVCAVQQILANQWNAEHPETQVQTTALVWPGIVELNAALAAGTPPEIFSLHAFRIPSYASKGALTPLTSYLEEAGIDVNDMVPTVREAVTYNGEIYAVPMDVHGVLAHLNLAHWQAAGLVDASGAPMIPTSMAEFETACQKVKDANGGPLFGIGDDDVLGTAWVWASIYAQLGGKSVGADGLPSVNTPESLEALNTFLRLRDEGCFSGGEIAKTYESFVQGDVASVFAGTWMVNEWDAQVRDPNAALKEYWVAPLPQVGDQPGGWGGSHTWVVPLGANADPERVRAAVGYLKHFWDNNLDWTRTGHATVRTSVQESAEYQALPHKAEYLAYGDNAVFNPATNWSVGYDQIMHEEVQAALLGQKSAEQALGDAQARLMDMASLQEVPPGSAAPGAAPRPRGAADAAHRAQQHKGVPVVQITGIRTALYEYGVRRPIGDVQLPDGASRIAELAVFLTTDEELTGVAIGAPASQPIVHRLAEELIGRDPREVRGLHDLLLRLTFKAGPYGVVGSAVAVLDTALWDLRAKRNGVPLWRELGGSSGRVAAYASGLDMPLSDQDLRTYYFDMAKRHGITSGKLKVGRDPDRDLERLAVLRDALAEGSGIARPSLMIDANEFWTPKQAIRRISEIEREFDIVWAEEPVRRDDHRGLARVSRSVRTAVATGENLTSVAQFVPLLLNEAADVIQFAVQSTGITTALRVAEMADALGLPVALVNCPGRYAAHVAAVLPNHLAMEVIDAGRDAVFQSDHRLEGGWIVLGDAPGLGITFDEGLLAQHASEHPSAESLGATYRRAVDSGISEPGIPIHPDLMNGDGRRDIDRGLGAKTSDRTVAG